MKSALECGYTYIITSTPATTPSQREYVTSLKAASTSSSMEMSTMDLATADLCVREVETGEHFWKLLEEMKDDGSGFVNAEWQRRGCGPACHRAVEMVGMAMHESSMVFCGHPWSSEVLPRHRGLRDDGGVGGWCLRVDWAPCLPQEMRTPHLRQCTAGEFLGLVELVGFVALL